ncbi:hypothetical protein [Chitinophaga solisilvae]|uniref:Uncharacterized protein n=1 Tax=Chitinophaga solisilvae TaxID=1233460 RepID=A0A9Q5GTC3_9BACT|nr:hypothetical protein [Chitinophaga solisilvae]NSL87739.1 hypothetical protein [Chitinophaga solisilvae]
MKKKIRKKLDISKMKISKLSEANDKRMKAATLPPHTFECIDIKLF